MNLFTTLNTSGATMVKIEINGKELHVQPGEMIIEAADKAGIPIPRFCYHKKLSIAANCRMCLVDVENVGKPLPACATPVSEGMKILTASDKAKSAQEAVMEFLLINHPLDCPVCDQGGQCELQDVALEYGQSYSRYQEKKRVVVDENLGPLIATEMTRCIHCTRCVRFGKEIAGVQELGATGRGEHMRIGTYIQQSVNSELSGNVIDLCPVGALTSKPYRFKSRAWEVMSQASIAMHDGLGSNLYYHTHHGKVVRVAPRENETLNEVWLSDRDRFSYEGLYRERLLQPEIKIEGKWQVVDWSTALNAVKQSLTAAINNDYSQLGVMASPNSTVEELYLLQKLGRKLGTENIDCRLHLNDLKRSTRQFDDPSFETSLDSLQEQESILVIGSLLQQEAPLVTHRIRQAHLAGASINVINPIELEYTFEPASKIINVDFAQSLLRLENALEAANAQQNQTELSEAIDLIAQQLMQSKSSVIIVGQWVEIHPQREALYTLIAKIAKKTQSQLNIISLGANRRGAYKANMLPNNKGLNVQSMFANNLSAYFLHQFEPEFDVADSKQAISALKQANSVIMSTPFVTESMREYCSILLPCVPYTESSGTFINFFGDSQSFRASTKPQGEARPAWKIFRVLGNIFKFEDFNYESSEEVLKELNTCALDDNTDNKSSIVETLDETTLTELDDLSFIKLAPLSLYGQDNVVRRAHSLQSTAQQQLAHLVQINPKSLKALNLKTGDRICIEEEGVKSDPLEIVSNDAVPEKAVLIVKDHPASSTLGSGYRIIKVLADVA